VCLETPGILKLSVSRPLEFLGQIGILDKSCSSDLQSWYFSLFVQLVDLSSVLTMMYLLCIVTVNRLKRELFLKSGSGCALISS